MKSSIKVVVFVFLLALIFQGCSRKKDTFINRAWHSVGTEYNTLYNGEVALQKGLVTVNNAYTENFWELLPVERFEVKDEIRLGNKAENSDFERAEEKATKAIQLHSMTIGGKEKNPQIDEAYLLLGKSRYYDQRFVPALAAFNNILNKYPSSDKINQVKFWREKTNLRLGSPELAIKNLKRHLKQEQIEGQDLADISAVLAEAYLNIKEKDTALRYIDTAAVATKINAQKARYNFIKGQLYNQLDKKDSANMAFDEIIEMHRKIPRAFYINAHLAKSNNFDADTGDGFLFLEYLTELEENRENRPFLDKIYDRIARFHQEQSRDSLAEVYYNKAIASNKSLNKDKTLFANNYLTLGDMYFDRTEYKVAGAYYDSTLTNMVEKTKPYRVVAKKRKNLDDVIYYEGIARGNDSILSLVKLPKEAQVSYFKAYIKELKTRDSLASELLKKKSSKISSAGTNKGFSTPFGRQGNNLPGAPGSNGDNSDFYFYNSSTALYGRNEFIKLWGERQLQDNWRLSAGAKARDGVINPNAKGGNEIVTQLELYEPDYYINKLPTDKVVLDSITKERNFAYYQLGLIYKENFKEYELAKNKLKKLLNSTPEERLILPSKYYLYKIYELLGETDEAEIAKNRIIAEHPDSRYAEILRNPNSQLARDENNPESIYENLYRKFENQEYAEVITAAEEQIKIFEGDGFVPKFEILKASAIGRLKGLEAYKEAVNYVALTYPNSEEGKRAQEILVNALPLMENKEFAPEDEGNSFYVVYEFDSSAKEEIKNFEEELSKIMERLPYKDITLSKDVYDENTTFLVVHGIKHITSAYGFGPTLQDYKEEKTKGITKKYFTISSANYAIIQRYKNLELYMKPE
ncbi:MAG: tetratricopeptide repeat protein [Winogradskyella sp.]|uniref:type IX secretion system periplasmic lipoprotein PorW/SprE n=1 Tax=Winogradskyella sp. TaxID=1883156 RepID=UPI0017AB21D7|nr:tetratricopeptide repeat protein [Winogradskyella sp.]MBT8245486.1 tetratricopeptide repeat protein [Winogradskyella sp.]NNK22293.1 tetratricopeptide repeat protein [Winogradskyella sp.]